MHQRVAIYPTRSLIKTRKLKSTDYTPHRGRRWRRSSAHHAGTPAQLCLKKHVPKQTGNQMKANSFIAMTYNKAIQNFTRCTFAYPTGKQLRHKRKCQILLSVNTTMVWKNNLNLPAS
jgi:hypothetical protein